jgi:putative redox protein
MKARIKWILGPRPMETVLIGTGGCTAYDVVHILKKARAPITDCVVEIDAERASEDPKIFTRIHFHSIVTGTGLKPQQVERAIHLSAEKYCSASIMLGKTAEITHDFEIRDL